MTLFIALGAPQGMTTLLKIAKRFSSAVVINQFMSYC
jgi:hypothetical protein